MASRLLAVGGILCIMAGVLVTALNRLSIESYRTLSEQTHVMDKVATTGSDEDAIATPQADAIDWNALWETNEDVAAWIKVENTDIDLPVLSSTEEDPEYYLSHNLWKSPALEGVPFLDHRCQADGRHRLVYGHRLSMGGQFSELQKAYKQEVFEDLGSCRWDTPEQANTVLLPFCSLTVDMWYEPIQKFSFDDDTELRQWLRTLAEQSSAHTDGWERLADTAESAITLVTCSSDVASQEWRTLVVFVEASA